MALLINCRRYCKKCTKTIVYLLMTLLYMNNGYQNEAKNEKSITKCDLNRPSPRHGHRFTKYKTCLSKMMVKFIKQHL